MSRIESCFRKLESIDRRAIESNDGRPSVPSVRASCNYFDSWTWFVAASVANPIYLWVYSEISDENLDREEFIYF